MKPNKISDKKGHYDLIAGAGIGSLNKHKVTITANIKTHISDRDAFCMIEILNLNKI